MPSIPLYNALGLPESGIQKAKTYGEQHEWAKNTSC